jgi:hypothetical protein
VVSSLKEQTTSLSSNPFPLEVPMRPTALLLSIAGCSALFAVAPHAQHSIQQSRHCNNSIRHEPLLLFEQSGGTLLGPVYRNLTVYSDGRATLTQDVSAVFDAEATTDTKVASVSLSPNNVAALWTILVDAGAFTLCDADAQVFDAPLNTVTIFDGRTDADAHTYSYWIGTGDHAIVDTVISHFIAMQFPDF